MLYRKVVNEYSKNIKGIVSKEEWEKLYKTNYESGIFNITCLLIRTFAQKHKVVANALNVVSTSYLEDNIPLSAYNKKTDKIDVFQNIMLPKDFHTTTAIENVCPFVASDVIEKVLTNAVDTDQKKELSKDLKFAKKLIKRKISLTPLQWLKKYTKCENKCSERDLKAIAAHIETEIKPLQLYIARGIEDKDIWIDMYSSGPSSCMHIGGGHDRTWAFMPAKMKIHTHPILYYGYHPDAIGVYYKKNGVVQARVILFKEKDKEFYHISCKQYQVDSQANQRLLGAIKQKFNCADTYVKDDAWLLSETFRIPGEFVKHKGLQDYIMPVPYTDNTRSPVNVAFDIKAKEFIIADGQIAKLPSGMKSYNLKTLTTTGYLGAKTILSKLECLSCGRKPEAHITALDGAIFCNDDCARLAGYRAVIEADGTHNYTNSDGHEYIEAEFTRELYTTQYAALRNGSYPFKRYPSHERLLWSPVSYFNLSFIKYRDQYFTVPQRVLDAIHKGRIKTFRVNGQVAEKPFEDRRDYAFYVIEDCEPVGDDNAGELIDW